MGLTTNFLAKTSTRLRAGCAYLAGGLACGLGGMFLLGLPVLVLACVGLAFEEWLNAHGWAPPDLVRWLSARVLGSARQLPAFLTFVSVVIAPLAAGFVYGWWAGMHGIPRARNLARRQPGIVTPPGHPATPSATAPPEP